MPGLSSRPMTMLTMFTSTPDDENEVVKTLKLITT